MLVSVETKIFNLRPKQDTRVNLIQLKTLQY